MREVFGFVFIILAVAIWMRNRQVKNARRDAAELHAKQEAQRKRREKEAIEDLYDEIERLNERLDEYEDR